MALTLPVEQQLQRTGLVDLFDAHAGDWTTYARNAYGFVYENYPDGSEVRRDDVAIALKPLIQVDQRLTNHLSKEKLRQKYWFEHFCDLIIDRCWNEIADE